MSYLNLNDHFLAIRKQILVDEESGDVVFRTGNKSFFGHSQVLLHHLEFLSSLVCDPCVNAHEKIVIVVPDVEEELLDMGLRELYIGGDSTQLKIILEAPTENYSSESLVQVMENVINEKTKFMVEELTFTAVQTIKLEPETLLDEKQLDKKKMSSGTLDGDNIKHKEKEKELFPCEMRDKVCYRKENLTTHEKQKHSLQKVTKNTGKRTCNLCLLTVRKRDIRIHIQEKHPESPLEFQCEQCKKKFRFKSKFERHMKQHSQNKEKLFCQRCNFQTESEDSFRRHSQRHDTLIKCDKCEYYSDRSDNFKRHHENKHGLKEETDFKCDTCEQYLPSKDALRKHKQRIHTY